MLFSKGKVFFALSICYGYVLICDVIIYYSTHKQIHYFKYSLQDLKTEIPENGQMYLKTFTPRGQFVMVPAWVGKPKVNLLMMKREFVNYYKHQQDQWESYESANGHCTHCSLNMECYNENFSSLLPVACKAKGSFNYEE